ncbi:UDP-N-acetylmuramoyl-tripeptide--D-alanyl-D-alanine ligase [Aquibium carbonis]|uniref:UDP-N-acetylmuramoyl-tripeptide--D-alanyl-D-alanine ligase n=1 Tax=Aquibium carbonis TaxID=2495581 RepID=A0A429YUQ7_9HYPH|nr:Mur ligase family protein [Aquibium carbonis]RST85196.1 UDP-N-acetylmuramoyl-tripeptide--D-alanyl-D-alanine ligase [Aquibium carbonis]
MTVSKTDHRHPLKRLFQAHVEGPFKHRLATLARARSKAEFICVTGSSGKSTTATLLAHILAAHGPTTCQVLANSLPAIQRSLRRMPSTTRYAVFETGIFHQGDMDALSRLARPTVGIVTLVNTEHYSSFRGREGVATEKGKLVEAILPGGFAVLNADDDLVASMAGRTTERVVTLARHAPALYRVRAGFPSASEGLLVEIEGPRGRLSMQTRFLADHFWLSCAAAAVTALELGVPPSVVTDRIERFAGVHERFSLYETKSGPRFVLDTAKAPWDTLFLSFDAFARLDGGYKRIVLGQISDYPGNPKPKYRDAFRRALSCSDQVIFVGENAHRSSASEEEIASGRFKSFATVEQATAYLRQDATDRDLILLKGSRNLHLDRIALAWDHDVNCWNDHCGYSGNCTTCGLHEYPFQDHARIRKEQRRWPRRGRGSGT